MNKSNLSHIDSKGHVKMVDVGGKSVTEREALARGEIRINAHARNLIRHGGVAKGDPLQAARVAGILAAKRTAELIPLCHPLLLTHVAVDFSPTRSGYSVAARVRTTAQTGVEMEALTAVQIALLTIYDMCKKVDRGMVIDSVQLLEKSGGSSGSWRRSNDEKD